MPTTNLTDAIDDYREDAATLFDAAHLSLSGPPPAAPPGEDPDQRRKRFQGQLSAAFTQLSTAETMLSAQQGRDGYAAVVELMKTTSTTAATICQSIASLTTTLVVGAASLQLQIQIIDALNRSLTALAQLSPSAVWKGIDADA